LINWEQVATPLRSWIKTSYTSRQAIIGNYGSTPAWCFELYSSGQLRMYVNNTGYNSPSTTDVDDGLWHHVVGVREINTNIIMYVDGEEVYNRGSDPAGSFTFNRNTYIGAIPYSSNHYYFSGEIDEVRIWNTARTQTQILDHMHNELIGDETGLVAYYNMEAGSGTTLEDNKIRWDELMVLSMAQPGIRLVHLLSLPGMVQKVQHGKPPQTGMAMLYLILLTISIYMKETNNTNN